MEVPKDYSAVYKEELAPMPAARVSHKPDGFIFQRRYEAVGIDPSELSEKLLKLTKDKACATNVLQQHYRDVGISHQNQKNDQVYGVYIQYQESKEVYLIRVKRNILREVKEKMPIKASSMFFLSDNVYEEIYDNNAILPYQEKDGKFIIRCRVFPQQFLPRYSNGQ